MSSRPNFIGDQLNSQGLKKSIPTIDLLTMVRIGFDKAKMARGRDIVLCIGNTGAGKSTTVAYLMGAPLQIVQNEKGEDVATILHNNELYPKIGETMDSETLYPEIWEAADGTLFCDCPGFFDNRFGLDKKIAISINMELILRCARTLKVVVFIPHPEITSKGTGFRDVTKLLSSLFSKPAENAQSVLWAITKAGPRVKPQHVLNAISGTSGILESLAGQLEAAKGTLTGLSGSMSNGDFLSATLNKFFGDADELRTKVKSIQHQQSILESISTSNLLLVNIETPETRNQISRFLGNMKSISASSFCFDMDDARIKFSKMAEEVAQKAIRLFEEQSSLQADVRELENSLKGIQKKIDSTRVISASKQAAFETLKANWERFYREENQSLEDKMLSNKKDIEELRAQIIALSSRELVQIHYVHYLKKVPFYTWDRQEFSYNFGFPFVAVQERFDKKLGQFARRAVIETQGIYQATYETGWGCNADVEVSISTEKRYLPVNQKLVECNQEKMQRLINENKEIVQKIQELNNQKSILAVNQLNIRNLALELDRFEGEKSGVLEKITSKKLKLSRVSLEIDENHPVFIVIHDLLSILLSGNSQSALFDKFTNIYTKHLQGTSITEKLSAPANVEIVSKASNKVQTGGALSAFSKAAINDSVGVTFLPSSTKLEVTAPVSRSTMPNLKVKA